MLRTYMSPHEDPLRHKKGHVRDKATQMSQQNKSSMQASNSYWIYRVTHVLGNILVRELSGFYSLAQSSDYGSEYVALGLLVQNLLDLLSSLRHILTNHLKSCWSLNFACCLCFGLELTLPSLVSCSPFYKSFCISKWLLSRSSSEISSKIMC